LANILGDIHFVRADTALAAIVVELKPSGGYAKLWHLALVLGVISAFVADAVAKGRYIVWTPFVEAWRSGGMSSPRL